VQGIKTILLTCKRKNIAPNFSIMPYKYSKINRLHDKQLTLHKQVMQQTAIFAKILRNE
jgi:hypothetical protein